jgi:hypothetical protein
MAQAILGQAGQTLSRRDKSRLSLESHLNGSGDIVFEWRSASAIFRSQSFAADGLEPPWKHGLSETGQLLRQLGPPHTHPNHEALQLAQPPIGGPSYG